MQGGGQTATVIQVSKGHTGGHTIIQQNGQHVIVGKIASGGNGNSNVDSNIVSLQGANSANGTGLQTLYPTHYIEAASEQTVYTSPGNGQM
ncbi:unnamed protein product [Protopolystoma xenopodis]|uniref:Uncharacterized protein n=1 Tax=Protopolystoma xenopodis TaxID=117903 RepID=A0A3S5C1J1_9PLAT|nr:unnamed protein product [Protopolystoma xenopodis]